jgi:hypothetical protein
MDAIWSIFVLLSLASAYTIAVKAAKKRTLLIIGTSVFALLFLHDSLQVFFRAAFMNEFGNDQNSAVRTHTIAGGIMLLFLACVSIVAYRLRSAETSVDTPTRIFKTVFGNIFTFMIASIVSYCCILVVAYG